MRQYGLVTLAIFLTFLFGYILRSITTSATVLAWGADDDASELKALVVRFFDLYAKKDLDGFMALWSEKSPEYASRPQTMRQLFRVNDHDFSNLNVSHMKVEGDKAHCRVTVDMMQMDLKTKRTIRQQLIRQMMLDA